MADQNNSNRGPMNQTDDIDHSSTMSAFERIGSKYGRDTQQRSEMQNRIQSEGKMLNDLLREGRRTPMIKEGPFYGQQVSGLRDSIRATRASMNGMDASVNSRAQSEAENYISKQFNPSSINGQVAGMMRDGGVQQRAFGMMGQTYESLQGRRDDIMANIRLGERDSLNQVKGMYSGRGFVDPSKSSTADVIMNGARGNFAELAAIGAAQAMQRSTGADPASKMKSYLGLNQQASSMLGDNSLSRELAGGSVNISSGSVKNGDIGSTLLATAEKLNQKFKELGEAMDPEKIQKAREELEVVAEDFKKLSDASGKNGGGGRGNALSYLGAAGAAFNAAAGASQSILVDQRMGQVNNAGGFANLANQQYGMYQKARGGDIASQLALGQFGSADDFGMEMKRGTNVVQGLTAASAATQVAAGSIQAASALNPLQAGLNSSAAANTAIQGAQNIIQGGSTIAVTAADAGRGVSAQSARLAGIQSQMAARMAINQIGASQAQGLRDMMTGLDVVGQGMGGRGSAFLQGATGEGNLTSMANARMSPDQFVAAAGQANEGLGSMFKQDGSQIYSARNLERSGYGSVGANIGRMSSLANAGANNPQAGLESVLSAAVASGLDSSKGINAMVEHTAAMVSASGASSAAGINTAGASASLLQGAMGKGDNREFSLNRAAQALDVAKAITTDTSVSFAGMVNTSRISKSTGLGGDNALFAAQLSTADIKSLQGMDSGAASEALLKKGVDTTGVKGGTKGFLESMLLNQTSQMFTGSGALAFGDNETRQGLAQKAAGGKGYNDLTTSEKSVVGKIGMTSGLTGEEYFNTAAGIKNVPNTTSGAGADLAAGKGGDDLKKQLDTLRTSGFQQLTEAAAAASKDLEKFGGALKVFSDLTAKYEKGGMDNEKEFAGAGGKYAKDFTASMDKFSSATTSYEKASQAMMTAAGLFSNRNPLMPNMAPQDQRKGSSAQ